MKLEVGMYVRDNIGRIYILTKILDDTYVEGKYKNILNIYGFNDIKKYSHNIIDLIEVGDFVNGKKVINVEKLNSPHYEEFNNDIKEILTKEKYESVVYKL